MVYIENFQPYQEDRAVYPYRTVYSWDLPSVDFAPITIFYGINGCGKSTMLNIIADKIRIKHKTLGNFNEYFKTYVAKCTYTARHAVPHGSAFIRSEDIMEGIVANRREYQRTRERLPHDMKLRNCMPIDSGVDDGELFDMMLNDPDRMSDDVRFFLSRCSALSSFHIHEELNPDFASNGEVAIRYFREMIEPDTLYLLDEPENSMAPKFQQELAELIMSNAYMLDCQFIIASHSPFMLSMDGARIYDLDARPACQKPWYELENMKTYFRLFDAHRHNFIGR